MKIHYDLIKNEDNKHVVIFEIQENGFHKKKMEFNANTDSYEELVANAKLYERSITLLDNSPGNTWYFKTPTIIFAFYDYVIRYHIDTEKFVVMEFTGKIMNGCEISRAKYLE